MDKPKFYYITTVLRIEIGESAHVTVRLPGGKVVLRMTSPVVDIVRRENDPRPVFETIYSIYIPADDIGG